MSELTVTLSAHDWRPNATEFNINDAIRTVVEGNNVYTLAIIGAIGEEIEVTVEVDRGIELLDHKSTTMAFQDVTRPSHSWKFRPVETGPSIVRIVAIGLERADTDNPASDANLAKVRANVLTASFTITVQAVERDDWLGMRWWHGLPLLILPLFPVGGLGWASRRREDLHATHVNGTAPSSDNLGQSADLGVVLSGGGLRATAFSLGVLMYVAEAGNWTNLRQIASVSGGSITNAFAANIETSLQRSPRTADELAVLSSAVANRGLPLERAALGLLGAIVVGDVWILGLARWSAPNLVAAATFSIAGCLIYFLSCWLLFTSIGLRPALRRWFPNFVGVPLDLRLRHLGTLQAGRISHVFSATTTSSNDVHMTPRQLVVIPRNLSRPEEPPEGVPVEITVSEAVRASAAFPGLPRVVLDAEKAGFASSGRLALRDAGTSDNLGHLHQTLFAADSPEQSFLTANGTIRSWIVVDSSAHRTNRISPPVWWLRTLEFLNLGAAADMAEIAQTSAAQQTKASASAIETHLRETGTGVYLGVGLSPFEIARSEFVDGCSTVDIGNSAVAALLHSDDRPTVFDPIKDKGFGPRAQEALFRLAEASKPVEAERDWWQRTKGNAAVRTTLSSLGRHSTVELLRHGYVLAAVTCHIELDWLLPEVDAMTEDRFRGLVDRDIDLRERRPAQSVYEGVN